MTGIILLVNYRCLERYSSKTFLLLLAFEYDICNFLTHAYCTGPRLDV